MPSPLDFEPRNSRAASRPFPWLETKRPEAAWRVVLAYLLGLVHHQGRTSSLCSGPVRDSELRFTQSRNWVGSEKGKCSKTSSQLLTCIPVQGLTHTQASCVQITEAQGTQKTQCREMQVDLTLSHLSEGIPLSLTPGVPSHFGWTEWEGGDS